MTRRLVRLIAALAIGTVGAVALACGSFSADSAVTPDDEGGFDDEGGRSTVDGVAPGADGSILDGGVDSGPNPAVVSEAGCADNTREGFDGPARIAACEGAWGHPGVFGDGVIHCQRAGGNNSVNPTGESCGAEDLCAVGWHVCRDVGDVALAGGTAGVCAAQQTDGGAFYATAQASDGTQVCSDDADSGFNDLFGCGSAGQVITSCPPLNVSIGHDNPVPNFVVGGDANRERANVIKAAGPGGVLCCRD